MTTIPQASRTAVGVCQGRAAADGRIAPGRFADPAAMALLRPAERQAVEWVRDDDPPRSWPHRLDFESVRAHAEMIVPRTVAIDDAVREAAHAQVVILGAGLDGRAWRMPGLTVFEVDHPASQQDKRARAADLPGRAPTYVPVTLGHDPLRAALTAAGHRTDRPTTWIWEGVVPYLTAEQVAATVAEVATCSAAGSRLVVNYQTPLRSAAVGRLLSRALTASAGRRSVWATEPWRSTWTPAAMAEVLERTGFHVGTDRSLLEIAEELGTPARHRRTLQHGRVAVAQRP
ncbi:class I SAM-dependent methyltransferase [Actinoplanes sp. NPDC049316]|uniref:class I SAM-dependent methyltransferase n=1 Tax=Actinoplanes sp. NPDC049316 TaxID=3154727 RepID=UPI0034183142